MGNRAVIFFGDDITEPGTYLHWNGGPESVLAFIETMRIRGWTRMDYAPARFTGVVVEFFDIKGDDKDGLSIGLTAARGETPLHELSHGDNGVFIITELTKERWEVTQYNGSCTTWKRETFEALLNKDDIRKYLGVIQQLAVGRSHRTGAK